MYKTMLFSGIMYICTYICKYISFVSETSTNIFILPYVKGTTDQISRILNKHNIQTIFKPFKKIGQTLRNPKDQRSPLSTAGMYKISCSCRQVYIEETGRMVNILIKEHQRDVRLKHVTQSALSERNIEKEYHTV